MATIYIVKNESNETLHSNGGFYLGFISMRGCKYVSYKTQRGAEKRLEKVQKMYPNDTLRVVPLHIPQKN